MKCVECNCTTTTFDERMGETICADCGLILSVNIFEETTKTIFIQDDGKSGSGGVYSRTSDLSKLGSIIQRKDVKSKTDYSLITNNIRINHNDSENKVLVATGIYLSYYNGGKLKNEVIKKYRILKDEHLVRGLPLDDVAAGIVYYVLKERGVPVSLKDYSKRTKVPIKNIMRTTKRVTRKFGKPHIFSQLNTDEIVSSIIDKLNSREKTRFKEKIEGDIRMDCYNFVDYAKQCYDNFDLTFTTSDIVAALWIVGQTYNSRSITQLGLADCSTVSEVTIREKARKMCNNLNLNKNKLRSYTTKNIMNGVR
jgi:transcription initiation factor TFIIIB Brf1 subunit/transcription initiation factor TFIIB